MQIKYKIKSFLLSLGLWYPLNLLRKIPEILHWLRIGITSFAPNPIKLMIIDSYLKNFSFDNFIETGTFLGDTLSYIARRGVQCISIELSQELYEAACKRFKTYKNVSLVHGDSGQRLPELLREIHQPVLFWLDGHYSSGITATAGTNTPVSAELKAILNHTIKQHVILIDDARCFNGTNGYPYIDDLLRAVREDGNYNAEISTDIIRLVPRTVLRKKL
jgi:hypothetical protein